jgi:hypothetical protein
MLGKMVIIPMLMCVSFRAACQSDGTNMQRKLDMLMTRVISLENENTRLKSEKRTSDSIEYSAMRARIFYMFNSLPFLDFDFKNTTEKIAMSELFTRLMQANNPSSDVLGFRFNDIIFSAAEKHLKETLKDEDDKKRFSQVLGKIISNPVVTSLAGTNPVTSVVASIISAIAGFSTSRVSIDREGGRIKNVSVAQQDAFEIREVTAFRKELQVYIDFYDAMITNSTYYIKGLEELKMKNTSLVTTVNDFKCQLETAQGISAGNPLLTLSNTLPDPQLKGLDYNLLLFDSRIRTLNQLVVPFESVYREVADFKSDYDNLLFNFLNENIKTLGLIYSFPETAVDTVKARKLVEEIGEFIKVQRLQE